MVPGTILSPLTGTSDLLGLLPEDSSAAAGAGPAPSGSALQPPVSLVKRLNAEGGWPVPCEPPRCVHLCTLNSLVRRGTVIPGFVSCLFFFLMVSFQQRTHPLYILCLRASISSLYIILYHSELKNYNFRGLKIPHA